MGDPKEKVPLVLDTPTSPQTTYSRSRRLATFALAFVVVTYFLASPYLDSQSGCHLFGNDKHPETVFQGSKVKGIASCPGKQYSIESKKGIGAQRTSLTGYSVVEEISSDNGLTLKLELAGEGCNVFGKDIVDLKVEIEYQTRERE